MQGRNRAKARIGVIFLGGIFSGFLLLLGALWLFGGSKQEATQAKSTSGTPASSSLVSTTETLATEVSQEDVQETMTTEAVATSPASSTPQTAASNTIIAAEIKGGNFRSVEGSWVNQSGDQLVFSDRGLVGEKQTLEIDAEAGSQGTVKGYLLGLHSGGAQIEFIPAGQALATFTDPSTGQSFADVSDHQRDRIWIGQTLYGISEKESFYYRTAD
ncbi:hypothetical protein [Streptococcus oriscaviae]|uniref:Lipoprotein n=1 Tax=Streptococcus oriscaviae TaxID=2781599 RepID=A0ABX7YIN4_9STRE|nr:hypothetical protein [Streptococcus oriscaviae]QUE53481.1 hypothetical protein INT76_06265 [Streptococcus oriscaviae]